MGTLKKITVRLTPFQSLLAGYVIIILAGSALLAMPVASGAGLSQPYLDALFTATSAVTTTGLTVVDTGSYYSTFGQMVILLLFQVGGLGYMVFVALVTFGFGGKLTLGGAASLHESVAGVSMGNVRSVVRAIVIVTIAVELTGALVLSLVWSGRYSVTHAMYMGLYHSVSAFCTAGFGLMGDSLSSFHDSALVNLTVMLICLLGGLGFYVILDLLSLMRGNISRLSLHTRLALWVTALIILTATGSIYLAGGDTLMGTVFQVVSASTTTGFNTVPVGALGDTVLLALTVLMFIGASPGGSGGGIKNTTFALMFLSLTQVLRKGRDAHVFKRRIRPEVITNAFSIALMAVVLAAMDMLVMTMTEDASFMALLFEAVSALGTVGLSTGITPTLTPIGKLLLCLSMLVGRLGPLAIGFALVGRPKAEKLSYADGEVFVG